MDDFVFSPSLGYWKKSTRSGLSNGSQMRNGLGQERECNKMSSPSTPLMSPECPTGKNGHVLTIRNPWPQVLPSSKFSEYYSLYFQPVSTDVAANHNLKESPLRAYRNCITDPSTSRLRSRGSCHTDRWPKSLSVGVCNHFPPGKPQNQRLSWLVTKTTAGLSGESAREKLMAADLWVGRPTSHLAET